MCSSRIVSVCFVCLFCLDSLSERFASVAKSKNKLRGRLSLDVTDRLNVFNPLQTLAKGSGDMGKAREKGRPN